MSRHLSPLAAARRLIEDAGFTVAPAPTPAAVSGDSPRGGRPSAAGVPHGGSVPAYTIPIPTVPPRRIVAVSDGLVYADDGTVWTRRWPNPLPPGARPEMEWYEATPPLPGSVAARAREPRKD